MRTRGGGWTLVLSSTRGEYPATRPSRSRMRTGSRSGSGAPCSRRG
jgi:hypothetical protein